MGKRLILILWAMAPMQAFCLGSGAIVGNGPDSTSGAPGSFSTVAVATSAVLGGSVLTSSGTVIIVSTTPDAGHDTLSVRAQDNSAVFTVESLTSGTGRVGIGTASPAEKFHMSSGTLLIDGNTAPGVIIRRDAGSGVMYLHNNSVNPTAGAEIGSLDFRSNVTGTPNARGSHIASQAAATWAAGSAPSRLRFYTTPSASLTPIQAFEINSSQQAIFDGNVGIGNTAPNQALSVTGDVTVGSMTVKTNFLMQNDRDINFKDTGGAARQVLTLTSGDVVRIGDVAGGYELALHSGAQYATVTSNGLWATPPSAQTIASGNVIAANGCGGLKRITAAGAVTTDTTNTFTAPAAGNAGCCMDVVNVGANAITLDNNALFNSAGAADVVLGANDTVRVCSSGASGAWYQIGATGNN